MRYVAILFVLAVSSICFGNGRDKPPAWATQSLERLWSAGVYQPPLLCGAKAASRSEYSVYTHAAYSNVRQALAYLELGKTEDRNAFARVEAKKTKLSTVSVDLLRLLDEFAPELKSMNVDAKAAVADAKSFAKRFREALAKRFIAAPPRTAPPEWAVKSVTKLKQEGLLPEYPSSRHSFQEPSRYELAVAVYAVAANLCDILADFDKKSSAIADGEPEAVASRNEWSAAFPDLVELGSYEQRLLRLTDEFYFELIRLGAAPEEMVARIQSTSHRLRGFTFSGIGERKKPFTDVAAAHWAAIPIQELKRAGIFVGHGNGRFDG